MLALKSSSQTSLEVSLIKSLEVFVTNKFKDILFKIAEANFPLRNFPSRVTIGTPHSIL
jgi:hypothetical protein